MTKLPVKEQVEIQEKPKTPEQEAMDKLLSMMEKPVQPPPISETLDKVEQAIAQAQKAKQEPVRQTWYCTECGGAHIQLYLDGQSSGHFDVDLEDNKPVNPNNQKPIEGRDKENMRIARAKSGR